MNKEKRDDTRNFDQSHGIEQGRRESSPAAPQFVENPTPRCKNGIK
jgi:hypothetical protein